LENDQTNSISETSEIRLDGKTNLFLNLFWIGFIGYILIYTFSVTGKIPFRFIVLFQMLQFGSIFLFVTSALVVMRFVFPNKYLMITFILYSCWQFVVIFRGFVFNFDYIKITLLDSWFGIFIYFAQFLMLFPKAAGSIKKIFNVIVIFAVFFVLFDLISIKDLLYPYGGNRLAQALIEYFSRNLSIPCGFILLTYLYHTDKRNIFALGIVVLTFLLAAIRARRSVMFMSMTLLVLSYLVFYFSNRGKIIKIVFSVILVASLGLYGAYVYTLQRSGMFGLLTSRMHEDTRSRVILNFYGDMRTTDWLFGKGSEGVYFCPGIDEGNRITTFRAVVETGYLQIILKGGLLSLVLMGMMAVPAVIKGLFYSKNILSKGAAIWVLWFILNLYNSVGNTFILSYLLFWFSIGICYDPDFREKSDQELKLALR
jgi:hypothetical protein